jgi:hypothetical protein
MPEAAKSISAHDTDHRKSTMPALPDVPMIHSMEELLAALRARRDELQLTHERVDDISGLPSGYFGKLMTDPPIRNLGWLSFGLALDALGVALVMVENPEQIKRVANRWIPRERPQPAGKPHPRRGNKSNGKPSLEIEESVKIAAPQSQPALAPRAHLRVVQSKSRGRRHADH